jgi:hypothetical protein
MKNYRNSRSSVRMTPTRLVVLTAIALAAGLGWGLNIYKLKQERVGPEAMFVLRVAGIFVPPLGAVLGYL